VKGGQSLGKRKDREMRAWRQTFATDVPVSLNKDPRVDKTWARG
jgi:hypothetical protein